LFNQNIRRQKAVRGTIKLQFSIFYSNIGSSFAEMLITALYESGEYEVVESKKLKNVIEELQLSMTGLIDSDRLKEVGNMGEFLLQMAQIITTASEDLYRSSDLLVSRAELLNQLVQKFES